MGRLQKSFVLGVTLAMALADVRPMLGADPRITKLDPAGGQRGTEVLVGISGARIADDPEGLLFSEPGIELMEIAKKSNNLVQARLNVSEQCALGPHHLRLLTATGLSNLVSFHVGAFPETAEAEPNNEASQAETIELGSVVNGEIAREDRDYFAVEVSEGERLSIEVEGLRLGRVFLDPAVEVIGPNGDVVAESDDSLPTHHDPSLSLIAPATGKYVIRLQEAALRGGGNHQYRLHVGSFARPLAVFPPVVKAGKPTPLRWLGPAAPTKPTEVSLAADHEETKVFPDEEAGSAPTGLPVRVTDANVITEQEPNDKRDSATPFSAPAAVAGILDFDGDRDFFKFSCKKNEAWDLRAYARQLRSPLDPVLRVYDAKGKQLAANDDDQGQPDSYVRFKAPAEGEYVLMMSDNFGRGGAGHTYAVEFRRPEPVVELTIHEERRYFSTTIDVPAGGRQVILLNTRRRDFGGPLEFDFTGLPAGVEVEAPTVAADYFRTPVVFTAAESATLGATLVDVAARRSDGKPVRSEFRQQEWFVRGANNVPVWSHFGSKAPVAVTRRAPFSIELVSPAAPLVQSGSRDLRIVAKRDEGFDAPIAVRMLYNPPGVSSNRSRSIPKGKAEALIPVTANNRAKTGDWNIVVTGTANVGGRLTVSTHIVTLKVAEPYFKLSLPKVATERGKSLEYQVAIEPNTPFSGVAKLQLVGLPPGVSTTPVEVAADAKTASFQLAIANDARLGAHRSLACRAVLTDQGEPVTHTQGGGELIIDPAPSEQQDGAKQTADRPAPKKGASS